MVGSFCRSVVSGSCLASSTFEPFQVYGLVLGLVEVEHSMEVGRVVELHV